MSDLLELMDRCPNNATIADNLAIAHEKINHPRYKKIMCSISGGADSDIVLDICRQCDTSNKIHYVWFNTGLEYQATKEHLVDLERKYGIEIERIRPDVPIPLAVKQYGYPFINKKVAEYIDRLQQHNFKWEDLPFEVLAKKYPNCIGSLKWWCNLWNEGGHFNIKNNRMLKEFLIANPPTIKISAKCCKYAKKDVAHKAIAEGNYELNIYGIRKAEGGSRVSVKSCFSEGDDGCDEYRPVFWYRESDKSDYENSYGIVHSRCYTEYGLKRTGCVGCPFAPNPMEELEIVKQYEPNLYKACWNIFGESYKYYEKYVEFVKENWRKDPNQINLDDWLHESGQYVPSRDED